MQNHVNTLVYLDISVNNDLGCITWMKTIYPFDVVYRKYQVIPSLIGFDEYLYLIWSTSTSANGVAEVHMVVIISRPILLETWSTDN
jgi:hypothetical protein